MTTEDDARLIGSIADAIAYLGVRRSGDSLLYAEAGENWVGGSLFINHAVVIEWLSLSDYHIDDLVLRLWMSAPDTKKWRALIMVVGENLFRTEFDYGEGWSEDHNEGDRREAIVRRFFGSKPIAYPRLDGDGLTDEPINSVMFRNA
jgi:hypothetical protein